MVWFLMLFEYWTAQPFEYRRNGCHLVFLCTGPVFEWYLRHNPWTDHLKSELQKVRYSHVSGIQMVGIQIPAAYAIVKTPL